MLGALLLRGLAGAAVSPVTPPATDGGVDRLLLVEVAATRLGVTPAWLYRHAKELPFTRKVGGRTLRFSERGLERWVKTRVV